MRLDDRGREIRTVCSWCPDGRERTDVLTRQGYAVSHTICEPCLVKVRAAQVPVPERRTA